MVDRKTGNVLALLLLLSTSIADANCIDPMTPTSREHLLSRDAVAHDDFFIICPPKCGSHLLMSVIHYMVNQVVDDGWDWVQPHEFSVARRGAIVNVLRDSKRKSYIHKTVLPYFQKLEQTFLDFHWKWLFLTRDPRDALVSLLFHVENLKARGDQRDFFRVDSEAFDALSFDNRLTALLTGSCCQNYMTEFYKPMMGWAKSSHGLTVRFEDLVGSEGKGSSETQLAALLAIAEYLKCDISLDELEAVALYSYAPWGEQQIGTKVHERGQIGSWRKFFKKHHKNIFKQLYGADLIHYGYEDSYDW